MSDYLVTFEAELLVRIDGTTAPTDAEAAQAVQDAIGTTGAVVTLVLDKVEE